MCLNLKRDSQQRKEPILNNSFLKVTLYLIMLHLIACKHIKSEKVECDYNIRDGYTILLQEYNELINEELKEFQRLTEGNKKLLKYYETVRSLQSVEVDFLLVENQDIIKRQYLNKIGELKMINKDLGLKCNIEPLNNVKSCELLILKSHLIQCKYNFLSCIREAIVIDPGRCNRCEDRSSKN